MVSELFFLLESIPTILITHGSSRIASYLEDDQLVRFLELLDESNVSTCDADKTVGLSCRTLIGGHGEDNA